MQNVLYALLYFRLHSRYCEFVLLFDVRKANHKGSPLPKIYMFVPLIYSLDKPVLEVKYITEEGVVEPGGVRGLVLGELPHQEPGQEELSLLEVQLSEGSLRELSSQDSSYLFIDP